MQPWVIALFVVLILAEAASGPSGGSAGAGLLGLTTATPGMQVLAWAGCLSPLVMIAAVVHLMCGIAGRAMDRLGDASAAIRAEQVLAYSRMGIVVVHAMNVIIIGELGLARNLLGDRVLLDELLVLLPPMLAVCAGWWSQYAIESRLRHAVLFRSVELGLRVHDVPSRSAYVIWNLRHHALLTFVPLCAISAWIELIDRLARGAARRTGALSPFVDSLTKVVRNDFGWGEGFKAVLGTSSVRDGVIDVLRGGGHLGGVLCVFILSPLVVRLVWDVQPLGKGPTRDALERLLERTGVRVRDILLWRTHGTLVNAAAVGVVRPLRYILLSDALLESLPERQVQAVMAHEIAHVRLRHMLWMGIAVVSMGVFLSLVASVALWAAGVAPQVTSAPRPGEPMQIDSLSWGTSLLTSGAVLGLTLSLFGFVSRRFEWQADAFAVRVLSHVRPRTGDASQVAWAGLPDGIAVPDSAVVPVAPVSDHARATAEAAESMAGALGSVAMLAHIPISRPSWRHGSIAARQARVRGIVGLPLVHSRQAAGDGVLSTSRRLPIDRSVRVLKWSAIALLVVSIGVIAAFGSYS